MLIAILESHTRNVGYQRRHLCSHGTDTRKMHLTDWKSHIMLIQKLLNFTENSLHNLDKPVCNTFRQHYSSSLRLHLSHPSFPLPLYSTLIPEDTHTALPCICHLDQFSFQQLLLNTQGKATSNPMTMKKCNKLNKIVCANSYCTQLINFLKSCQEYCSSSVFKFKSPYLLSCKAQLKILLGALICFSANTF